MVEQEKPKIPIPHRIATGDIMDPQCRWTCQRLDAILKVLTTLVDDLLPEIRAIKADLETVRDRIQQV